MCLSRRVEARSYQTTFLPERSEARREASLDSAYGDVDMSAAKGTGSFNERLTDVLNRVADPMANCVFMGPTALDFSMLKGPLIPSSEQKLLSAWKERDLSAFYAAQRSNRYR